MILQCLGSKSWREQNKTCSPLPPLSLRQGLFCTEAVEEACSIQEGTFLGSHPALVTCTLLWVQKRQWLYLSSCLAMVQGRKTCAWVLKCNTSGNLGDQHEQNKLPNPTRTTLHPRGYRHIGFCLNNVLRCLKFCTMCALRCHCSGQDYHNSSAENHRLVTVLTAWSLRDC